MFAGVFHTIKSNKTKKYSFLETPSCFAQSLLFTKRPVVSQKVYCLRNRVEKLMLKIKNFIIARLRFAKSLNQGWKSKIF